MSRISVLAGPRPERSVAVIGQLASLSTARAFQACSLGRGESVRGWADPDDGGELSCGVAAVAPPDSCHGDTDRKVGFDQELGQPVGPNMSEVPHGRHPEALAEGPAQL